MGRWTQYDEDETRLPDGMTRTGYDADTGRYYFQDRDGAVWQGAQGAQFSEMTRVSGPQLSQDRVDEDLELPLTRSDGYQVLNTQPNPIPMVHNQEVNAGAYRTLFPFFLIIAVILLLVWRLILSPGLAAPDDLCPEETKSYWVQPGDTCWEISKVHGCSFDDFKALNPNVQCESLMPGTTICLPDSPPPLPT